MTRTQFLAALAKFPGVTQDLKSEEADNIQIDAPKGYVFMATGTHTMVEPYRNHGGQSWKPQAYADIVSLLELGLDPCDDPQCEYCTEE